MTLTRYLIGLCLLGVSVGPVIMGADAWRRRLLPRFVGPPGRLASGMLSLATVLIVSELLGTIGLFRLVPVTVALAAVGLIALRLARRPPPGDRTAESASVAPVPPNRTGRLGAFAGVAVTALVFGEWSTRVFDVLRHGMPTADTLWYHMPVAAHFVQDGWTSHLHVYGKSYITYFPSTSEVFHALGIMFLGSDVLSLFMNLGWLALALFAGWCIGRPFGVAPVTLIAVALVLMTPELLVDDAGSALNDVVGIALFLAAIALLAHAMWPDERRQLGRAELAIIFLTAGLALGTKYTLIGPVAALLVGTLAIGVRRPVLLRRAVLCVGAIAVGGSYWYLRNLFAVGNPLPTLSLGLGRVHLPTVPMSGTSSVSKYLFDGDAWRDYFLPGMGQAFGPVWWVFSAAIAGGVGLAVVTGPGRFVRMLAVLSAFSLAIFLFTPQILGPPGATVPRYFAPNARYAAIGLTLGLVVLPLALTRFADWAVRTVVVGYACIAVGTQFGGGVWKRGSTLFSPKVRDASSMFAGAVFGVVVLVVGLVLLVGWARRPRPPRARSRVTIVTAAVVVVALGVGLFGVSRYYLHRRYQATAPLVSIYRWAQGVHDERIAAVNLTVPYPLFGKDLSNRVEYVVPAATGDPSTRVRRCQEWRRRVNDRRYSYVVVAAHGFPFAARNPPPSLNALWTRSDPAAQLVMKDSYFGAKAWLYKINGKLDPQGCSLVVLRTAKQP